MVLGNLALLLGVHPKNFHDWHYDQFSKNHRMALQMKNVDKKRKSEDFEAILSTARRYKRKLSE